MIFSLRFFIYIKQLFYYDNNRGKENNMKQTNLKEIQSASKALLYAVSVRCDNPFGIISHPFTNNVMVVDDNHQVINITDCDVCMNWKNMMAARIDNANLERIYMMINKPWRITWLKYVEQYMSNSDFASYLSDAYVSEEMPNLNPNVTIKALIQWFKRANKKDLMDTEELCFYEELPDTIELYRGVSHEGTELGISWTTEYETAKWFAERFATDEHKARIYKVVANKENCLCYFGNRGEHEIILDVESVKNKIYQLV